jgi:hypothetical protein
LLVWYGSRQVVAVVVAGAGMLTVVGLIWLETQVVAVVVAGAGMLTVVGLVWLETQVVAVVVAGAGMLAVVGLVWLETSGCCGGCRSGNADCCWFGMARDKRLLLLWLTGGVAGSV